MSTKRETSAPRLAGTTLCAAASVLLLLSSFFLFASEGVGWGAGLLLLVACGLLLAALKSHGSARGVR